MDQRQYRVELDWKPPIGRGDQRVFPSNADRLADQVCLSGPISDVLDYGGGNTVLVRIPGREIVRVVVALIAGRAYVEYGIARSDAKTRKRVEDLAPLIAGDPCRQRSRPRDIVLGIHPRSAKLSIRSMARSLRCAIFSFQHRRHYGSRSRGMAHRFACIRYSRGFR